MKYNTYCGEKLTLILIYSGGINIKFPLLISYVKINSAKRFHIFSPSFFAKKTPKTIEFVFSLIYIFSNVWIVFIIPALFGLFSLPKNICFSRSQIDGKRSWRWLYLRKAKKNNWWYKENVILQSGFASFGPTSYAWLEKKLGDGSSSDELPEKNRFRYLGTP